jgi:hypothetical protein
MEKVKLKVLPVHLGLEETIGFLVEEEDFPFAKGFYEEVVKPDPHKYLSVTIERWHRKRSLDQNSLWHKMLTDLARHIGQDMELVKIGVKEWATEYGYPTVEDPINHRETPLPSHKANVKQMSVLVDSTFAIGGELGCDLSKYVNDVQEARSREYEKEGRKRTT